jgi:hypothetical protein
MVEIQAWGSGRGEPLGHPGTRILLPVAAFTGAVEM